MACGLLETNPRWRRGGKTILFSVRSLSYTDARREVSRTALSYGSLVARQSPKIFMDSFKHCFVVWMDAFLLMSILLSMDGVESIVLLSRDILLENQFHCVQD
ncbi:hypothetical protein TNCT_403211 [Trichonephila clavata]|uniref:Uncharacterized protein n=1 Tax=Trichonephila clavata TaxID=2740835 RepID=A0A8X6HC03_TRICU|nr:hypothetical protein TNCT_403211 [Trichonephila clavata]